MDTFVVGVSPDKITSGLIDIIGDALREPCSLQVVGRGEGEDRCN
jgi:hypothetical protein